MEMLRIPNWLKGLTPKKIAPDSSDAPAGESGQLAETDAIPSPTAEVPKADGVADDFGGYRLAPDAEGSIQTDEKIVGEIIGPDGRKFHGIVKKTPEGLKIVGGDEVAGEGFIITPEKKIVGRINQPVEESAVPASETLIISGKTESTNGDVKKGIGKFTEGLAGSFEVKEQEYADRILAGEDAGKMGVPDSMRGNVQRIVAQRRKGQVIVEAPAADNLNISTDKLPDWLMPDTSAVSAPLPDAGSQVVDNSFVAPPDAPAIDEHFFGQTSEEIQAEKARKRAELAAQAVPTPEAPIKTTMEEDLTAKGFKETPFPESDGSQTWVNQGGETVRQAKFEETGLESEFDEGLKAAGSLQEVAALMEKKLEELESSATEGSRAVEKLETEKDQLARESAIVQKYASRHLPGSRSKDRFAQAERANLIAARTRYWEIQARLTQINGDAETTGELALVKQNLTKEELTTEARRLRQIQQTRWELEKWDTLAEQPFLYERYRELAHQKAEAEKNFAPSVASVVNESAIEEMDSLEQMLPWRLLEMEGLMPERGHGPEVSLDTSEETFAYNRALNRFRELLGPATEAYRQKATPPETESASAPTAESADDAQQTIIDLKARVAQLEAELAKKAPSPAETAESNEDEIINQLPEQVRQRLAEVGKITPQDGQQARGLEDQIGKMIAEGVEGGEINRRMAEMIKRLPEAEQSAARDSLQRQLMARSIEISRDGSLAPDEKKRRINSLSDLAKGVAETGELVFPGLEGLFDFLMQNIVDSLNTAK